MISEAILHGQKLNSCFENTRSYFSHHPLFKCSFLLQLSVCLEFDYQNQFCKGKKRRYFGWREYHSASRIYIHCRKGRLKPVSFGSVWGNQTTDIWDHWFVTSFQIQLWKVQVQAHFNFIEFHHSDQFSIVTICRLWILKQLFLLIPRQISNTYNF